MDDRDNRSRQMTIILSIRFLLFFLSALIVAFLLHTLAAHAQQRTIYGSDGKAIGRSTTDSQGTTTLYGSDGKALTRESPRSGGSTIYDAQSGRQLGTTQDKRK